MKKTIIQHMVVIGMYVVLTVVLTWPVVGKMTQYIAGSGGDPWQTMWRMQENIRVGDEAISQGDVWELLKHEVGGLGEARLVNLSAWPWIPLVGIFGVVVGYNLAWLSSFVMAGYGMYLLVCWLISTFRETAVNGVSETDVSAFRCVPGFLAGLVYMLLPYHVAHARGHWGAMQIQWLPLIILTAWSLTKKPKPLKAIILMGLLTMQAWTEHHYLLWLLVGVVWFSIYFRDELKKFIGDKRGGWYLAAIFVCLAVTVGMSLRPTIELASQNNGQLDLGKEQIIRYSADPFAYVVPAPFQTIWGTAASKVWGNYFTGNVEESTLFLGILPLLMVVFFGQRVPARQYKFWFGTAIIFFIISLGPRLHLLGYVTRLVLPWDLVDSWPIISAVRTLARAGVMVGLAWSVLFGWVIATQVRRWGGLVIISGIIIIEFMFVPVPMMSAQTPAVYGVIKNRPGQAIVEIPTATNYTVASRALYGSLEHKKTVLNNIALERAEGVGAYSEIKSLPALRQLMYLRTSHLLERRNEFMEQDMKETMADVMRWLKAEQIVVHPDSLSEKQREAVVDFLEGVMGLKRETVDDVWLYEAGNLPLSDGVFITRDDGWGEVGKDPDSGKIVAGIKDVGLLTLYNQNDRPVAIQLSWGRSREESLTIEEAKQIEMDWDDEHQIETIRMNVQPGKSVISVRNSSDKAVLIIDPILRVMDL